MRRIPPDAHPDEQQEHPADDLRHVVLRPDGVSHLRLRQREAAVNGALLELVTVHESSVRPSVPIGTHAFASTRPP